jgi:hypothetical protein
VGLRGLERDRQRRGALDGDALAGVVADRRGIADPPARRLLVEGELDAVEAVLTARLDPDETGGLAAVVRMRNGGGPERGPRGRLGLQGWRTVGRPDPEEERASEDQQDEISQRSRWLSPPWLRCGRWR